MTDSDERSYVEVTVTLRVLASLAGNCVPDYPRALCWVPTPSDASGADQLAQRGATYEAQSTLNVTVRIADLPSEGSSMVVGRGARRGPLSRRRVQLLPSPQPLQEPRVGWASRLRRDKNINLSDVSSGRRVRAQNARCADGGRRKGPGAAGFTVRFRAGDTLGLRTAPIALMSSAPPTAPPSTSCLQTRCRAASSCMACAATSMWFRTPTSSSAPAPSPARNQRASSKSTPDSPPALDVSYHRDPTASRAPTQRNPTPAGPCSARARRWPACGSPCPCSRARCEATTPPRWTSAG